MRRLLSPLIALVVLLAAAAPSAARTWSVERDGTGDYTVIQDAVDAAASGDTILIGPGRFDEGRLVTTPGWTDYVRVLVEQEELILIGSGEHNTIIGPEAPYDYSQGNNKGIEAGPWWGNQRLVVRDIGFENMGFAIRTHPTPEVLVANCRFSGNYNSVFFAEGGVSRIQNCYFEKMPLGGEQLLFYESDVVVVSDCIFQLDKAPFLVQEAVKFQATNDGLVEDCTFHNGKYGLGLVVQSSVQVNRCSFFGQEMVGLYADGGSSFNMQDGRFEDQTIAFYFWNMGEALIERTVITDVREAAFRFNEGGGNFTVRESVLARGPQYTVAQYFPCYTGEEEFAHIDMRNNDWGTTDPDSIEAWISTCSFIVDYEPFVGQETPVEDSSLGSFKSMFR